MGNFAPIKYEYRRGRKPKIEEASRTNLGIIGMRLLEEKVNDPNVTRDEKLKALEPYLTRMIPQLIEVEAERLKPIDRAKCIESIKSARQLLKELQ